MANLNFAVALNLLTDNFNRGTKEIANGFRSIQMQGMAMFAAMAGGGLGFISVFHKMIDNAKEFEKVNEVLKNTSKNAWEFGQSQKFIMETSNRTGVSILELTGYYGKFAMAAKSSGIPIKEQQEIFKGFSLQAVKMGNSAEGTAGMFGSLTKMAAMGTLSSKNFRGIIKEMPDALNVFSSALGVTGVEFMKMLKSGTLLSSEVLPKVSKYLQSTLAGVNTDTIEGSLNRISNTFTELTEKSGVGNMFKKFLDSSGEALKFVGENFKLLGDIILNVIVSVIIGKGVNALIGSFKTFEKEATKALRKTAVETGTSMAEAKLITASATDTMKFAFKSLGATIKSVFISFAPMAIIGILMGLYQYFDNIATKTKELKAIWTDYEKGFNEAGKNNNQYNSLVSNKKIVDDTTKSYTIRRSALDSINSILGTNFSIDEKTKKVNGDINEKYKERLKLIEKEEQLKFAVDKHLATGDKLNEAKSNQTEASEQVTLWDKIQKTGKNAKGGEVGEADAIWNKHLWKSKLEDANNEVKPLQKTYDKQSVDIATLHSEGFKDTSGTTSNYKYGEVNPKESKVDKSVEAYKEKLKEYINQLSNKTITEAEQHKLIDELNQKYKLELSGLLTKGEASKNKTYQGILNAKPLTTEQDKASLDSIESTKKFNEEQKKLNQSIASATELNDNSELTGEELNNEKITALKAYINSVKQLTNLNGDQRESLNNAQSDLKELEHQNFKAPNLKSIDHTFDYNKTDIDKTQDQVDNNKDNTDILSKNKVFKGQDIEAQIKAAGGDLSKLKAKFGDDSKQLIDQLAVLMKNAPNLESALKIKKVKQDVKDLQKEFNNGLYGGIKNVVHLGDNLQSSWKNISKILKAPDASGWEKFMAVFDGITSIVDGILGIIDTIKNLGTVMKALGGASTALSGAKVAAAVTETAANSGLMAAETAASYAALGPFGIAPAAAQIATYEAMIVAAAIPKFEKGGIVQGSSLSGDKIMAGLNAGEMVLNTGQQSTLFQLLNSGSKSVNNSSGGVSGKVEFKIDAKQLVGVIDNYNKSKSRVK